MCVCMCVCMRYVSVCVCMATMCMCERNVCMCMHVRQHAIDMLTCMFMKSCLHVQVMSVFVVCCGILHNYFDVLHRTPGRIFLRNSISLCLKPKRCVVAVVPVRYTTTNLSSEVML